MYGHLELKMSSSSKYSEWRGGSSRSAQPEIDFTSPGLAVMEVERLLFSGKAINSAADEVWPKLYIGDMNIAENLAELRKHHFTHILNCAQSSRRGGKILVHCHVGVSRSATIVLAYLMLKHNMTLVDSINTVKEGRGVIPNRGFLRQLIDLHIKLYGYRNK
ncbi:dual specificity protein phosphatase 26-like isoform X2 [Triplophysa rosa]|uniref:dual specificity protein phosphatase 26-like isoform X2 n=1 Tax=Triplophysa rosa TaxID=992332 RepID=UPI002545E88C|nr:dual specificity protein phosphatase 26-like isoform X2 [Triplophysa rosa]